MDIYGFSSGYLWMFLCWFPVEYNGTAQIVNGLSPCQCQTARHFWTPNLWNAADVLYEKHHVTPLSKGGNLIRKKEHRRLMFKFPMSWNFMIFHGASTSFWAPYCHGAFGPWWEWPELNPGVLEGWAQTRGCEYGLSGSLKVAILWSLSSVLNCICNALKHAGGESRT